MEPTFAGKQKLKELIMTMRQVKGKRNTVKEVLTGSKRKICKKDENKESEMERIVRWRGLNCELEFLLLFSCYC